MVTQVKEPKFGLVAKEPTSSVTEYLEWPGNPEGEDNQKFWVITINNESRIVWFDGGSYNLMTKSGDIVKSSWETSKNNKWFKCLLIHLKIEKNSNHNWYGEIDALTKELKFQFSVLDNWQRSVKIYSDLGVYLCTIQHALSEGWVKWTDRKGFKKAPIQNLKDEINSVFEAKRQEALAMFA